MAFTDVETAQAHEAVCADPTGEDLCKLGILYSTGQGGEIDYIEAHKWFNLAALMGSEPAKHYRKEISDQMSTGEIAAAQRAAREQMTRLNAGQLAVRARLAFGVVHAAGDVAEGPVDVVHVGPLGCVAGDDLLTDEPMGEVQRGGL